MVSVSIIIINYNTADFTVKCINSLLKHTPKNLSFQYIIVDNASHKESFNKVNTYVNSLRDEIDICLLRSKINTGFGGGNMLGVQKAKGTYLAFVNNDVELENDCFTSLYKFMEENPQAGVCGPQAFNRNNELLPTIDHFASLPREFFGRKFLEKINAKKYPKRKKEYSAPVQAQFVAGSFMFFKAEYFNKVGGFDTNIFLYYEETDICKRLLSINKLAYLVPEGKFIHYHGASTEKSIKIKTELKISLLYVIKKHYGLVSFYILLTYLQIRYFFSSIVKPKYWPLFWVLLLQAPLTKSIKHAQEIID